MRVRGIERESGVCMGKGVSVLVQVKEGEVCTDEEGGVHRQMRGGCMWEAEREGPRGRGSTWEREGMCRWGQVRERKCVCRGGKACMGSEVGGHAQAKRGHVWAAEGHMGRGKGGGCGVEGEGEDAGEGAGGHGPWRGREGAGG